MNRYGAKMMAMARMMGALLSGSAQEVEHRKQKRQTRRAIRYHQRMSHHPHQGHQEKARRVRQREKGLLDFGSTTFRKEVSA
jgi:hypothetical protein